MPAHLFLEAPPPVLQVPLVAQPALFRGGFQSGLIDGVSQRRAYLRIDMDQIVALSSGAATGVEVSVWRETSFGAPISEGFLYHRVHPLVGVTWSSNDTIGIGIDFEDQIECYTNLYWVQVTPVIYSGSPGALTITNSWHPFFGALAMGEDDLCVNLVSSGEIRYWLDLSSPLPGLPPMTGGCGNYYCKSFGTTPAGAVVGRRRLPPLTSSTITNDANAPHVLAAEFHTITY